MSAFLKFSQGQRAKVKESNPDMSNTDVSRLLGEMWRNASPSERKPFVEEEVLERAKYKEDIKKFRDDQAKIDAASRKSHKVVQKVKEHPPQQQMYGFLYPGQPSSYGVVRYEGYGGASGQAYAHASARQPYIPPYIQKQNSFPPIPGM
jgi:hypothetical protein